MIASVKNELTFISTTEHATTAAAIAALEKGKHTPDFIPQSEPYGCLGPSGRFYPTRGVKRWSLLGSKEASLILSHFGVDGNTHLQQLVSDECIRSVIQSVFHETAKCAFCKV